MQVPVNTPIIDSQDIQSVNECLESGWISSQGPYLEHFEKAFADYMGSKNAVSVSNGSAALDIAVQALKLPKGSEVIVPDFTIFSPAISVIRAGLIPVFVDVNIDTCNCEVDTIMSAITENTSAIIVVHTYGLTVKTKELIDRLKHSNVKIIEDCAEAHGIQSNIQEKIGSHGHISTFSFYPNKLITTGEGGMVITNDSKTAQNLRELRNIGFSEDLPRYQHTWLGYNYRMTSMQAALGVSQLKKIEKHLELKYAIGDRYNKAFSQLNENVFFLPPKESNGCKNSYWIYGIRLRDKKEKSTFQAYLNKNNIGNRDYFYPLHKQPALKGINFNTHGECKNTTLLSETGLYIPSGLGITYDQQSFVIKTILNFYR